MSKVPVLLRGNVAPVRSHSPARSTSSSTFARPAATSAAGTPVTCPTMLPANGSTAFEICPLTRSSAVNGIGSS